MRNGRKIAAGLLTVIGAFCLVLGVVLFVRGLGGESGLFGPDSQEKQPYCLVEPAGAVRLGASYEGAEAKEGYSFYELFFLVSNEGDEDYYRELPTLYYEGEEYDDVYDYWYWEEDLSEEEPVEEPLFYGDYSAFVPQGRTAKASQVVQLKDGVDHFTVSYYPDYYSDEELAFTFVIE